MKRKIALLLAIILIVSAFAACASQGTGEGTAAPASTTAPVESTAAEDTALYPPVYGDEIETTDYSNKDNWLNIPDTDYEVDVFYLYPTAWTRTDADPYYCQIDNASMRAGAQYIYTGQAAAFEPVANVYAPYYRQIDAVWVLDRGPLEEGAPYFEGLPLADAVAAFEYYLENYNNGKPFILAGHSQGSSVTKGLLKYYMAEHPDVYERMVAAYVIGFSVTESDLKEYSHLKFAQGADDTGVIISWNVEAPGTEENPLLFEGAISINPISWTLDETTATKEENLGSLIANRAEQTLTELDNLADATVNKERGSVICSTVDVEVYNPGTAGLFPRGCYHMQDYGFYFDNITENAGVRIDAYLAKN